MMMPGYGHATPSIGWRDLIKRMPRMFARRVRGIMTMDEQTNAQLNHVHHNLLGEFQWTPDSKLYKKRDYWTLPRRAGGLLRGDCEDFALEARRRLVEAHGWPREALRLALCMIDEKEALINRSGRGHMVLTADIYRAGEQTLVLDCNRSRVLGWEDYGWDVYSDPFVAENGRWLTREVPGRLSWERIGQRTS